MHAGQRDDTLVELLRANVRTPDQTLGDIWAQVSANELMERRVLRLMDEYGLDGLGDLADELFGRSEGAMRQAIRAVPDAEVLNRFPIVGIYPDTWLWVSGNFEYVGPLINMRPLLRARHEDESAEG